MISQTIYKLTVILLLACPAVTNSQVFKPNLIRSWSATAPEQSPDVLKTRPLKDVKQSTQYFDGLGRGIQTVEKMSSLATNPANPTSSADAVDIVNTTVYDQFGREEVKYLSFPANTAGGNASTKDGLYKPGWLTQQSAFYNDNNAANPYKGQGETFFYRQSQYERSALDRVNKTLAEGNNWVGSNRGIETKYWTNTAVDEVRIWNVTEVANAFGAYGSTSTYPAGALYKNVTVDEHNKQTIEFSDKDGHLLLRKVQLTATSDDGTGRNHANWLCTYYIYDDRDNLRCVIQPRGVELLMQNTWNTEALSGAILKEQCFRYEYDQRDRLIRKKVPGAGEVYLVYDIRDRLVLTQEANLRAGNKWLFTKYDKLNRPIMTGFYVNNTYTTLSAMQGFLNGQTLALFENYQPASYPTYTINNSFPVLSSFDDVLTVTYYDNYTWSTFYGPQYAAKDNSFDSYFDAASNITWPYPQSLTAVTLATGQITGQWDKTGGLVTANFYDSKARLIQQIQYNYTQGIDIMTTQYSFSGQPLTTVLRQQHGGNGQTNTIISKMDYDDLGRLISIRKKVASSLVNNGTVPANYTTILTNEYNSLGQLKKKTLGGGLESVTNDYNIRGWLLGSNREYLKDQGSTGYAQHYFGYELGFDKCAITPGACVGTMQFNGNIGAQVWKSLTDEVRRRYSYYYDEANRLNQANYSQNATAASGGTWGNSAMDFSVGGFASDNNKITYDANGNLQTMVQKGYKVGSPAALIDGLRYQYYDHSNKLRRVIDDYNDNGSTLGDFKYDGATKHAERDYGYDLNGNLVTDDNKKIGTTTGLDISSGGGVTYNHQNLPVQVVTPKGTITYVYDNVGKKLRKTAVENNATVLFNGVTYNSAITTITNYVGDVQYESKSYVNGALSSLNYNDKLLFIAHEEGRIRYVPNPAGFVYDYFLKDHLGNVRMVITSEQQSALYLATMEEGNSNTTRARERQLFSEVDATAASVPGGYPQDKALTKPNSFVAKLNGNGRKMGPGLVLRVMARDTIKLGVQSFYRSNTAPGANKDIITDVLSSLAAGIGSAGEVGKGMQSNGGGNPLGAALQLFRRDNNLEKPGKPKAFLNWILLDDQFNFVSAYPQSGAVPVGKADELSTLSAPEINIGKSGYLYIYVSNETQNWDVFFDNLAVQQLSGPILEETHYYPFGLTMSAISNKSNDPSLLENRRKYNGIEFETDLGINLYDAHFRELDPQLGRWWQVDPKIENMEMWSPYASNYDNPIRFSDPLGDEGQGCCRGLKKVVASVGGAIVGTIDNNIPGSNLRTAVVNAIIIEDPEVAQAWNTALDVADQTSIVQGTGEAYIGTGVATGSAGLTVATGGLSSEVTVPGMFIGTGMAAHGIYVASKATQNLNNQTGRVSTAKMSASKSTTSKSKPLPEVKTGPGAVPPDQRDKQRAYTKKQRAQKLEEQKNKCASCGTKQSVETTVSHHKERHADGGKTDAANQAVVCPGCHSNIHKRKK